MTKTYQMTLKNLPFYLFFSLSLLGSVTYSQQNTNVKVKQFDISQRKVFIENKGQFQAPARQNSTILYAFDEGQSKIYFTSKGLIYSFTKVTWKDNDKDKQNSIGEEEENEKPDIKTDMVDMDWVGANPTAQLIAEDKTSDYFSYSINENGKLKNVNNINGYQKLIYKNIYPGIDVEYVFNPKGGVEYSILVHPGADLSVVKMKYSDNHKVRLENGDIHVTTDFGDIIDHRPNNCYNGDKHSTVASWFKLGNDNTVSFEATYYYYKDQILVIDPWTITPSFPHSNKIWNCQTDALGNVYLYGGDSPLLLRKYTSTNTLLWTYTTTWDSANYWLGTLITDRAGNSYITSGANGEISKITTGGALVWHNNPNGLFGPLYEYWHEAFNCDQTQLVVSGTELPSPFNTAGFRGAIFNINLTNGSIANQIYVGYTFGFLNSSIDEGRSICSAPDGNYYFLTLDTIGSVTAALGLNWKNISTYNFSYGSPSYTVKGNMGQNNIKATQNFLYTQNGTNVHQRSMTNGSILLTATIPGGGSNSFLGSFSPDNSGLDIDSCGNVYVGSTNQVVEYDANLNQLSTVTSPNAVYDVAVNNNGEVIACGDGFAMSIAFSACKPPTPICRTCNPPALAATNTPANCNGSANGTATVTPTGNNPPYTYNWSPSGGSNATATGLSAGTYTVSVTDALGCNSITSVTITQPLALSATFTVAAAACNGNNGSATVTPTGGTGVFTYSWSPIGGTNATASGLSAGNYNVIITDANGCTNTATTSVGNSGGPTATFARTDATCYESNNGTATATASGGTSPYTYSWAPSGGTNATASGLSAGIYTITITDNSGCKYIDTVKITQPAKIVLTISGTDSVCSGFPATITATGGGTYLWSNSSTSSSITVNPSSTTTYSLTVTSGGCNADTTFTVAVKASPKITFTVPNDSICTGDSANITISGGGTYLWSTGSTNASIYVKPAATSTYTAIVTKNGCTKDTTITIIVNSPPVVKITGANTICSGETTTLTASGGGKYKWNTGSTTDTINVSPTTASTYSVSVFNGCTGSASATINVDNPTLFACCDTTIESGNSTHLSSSGGGIVNYVWVPSMGLNCDTCPNVIATPTATTTYTIIGTDSLGCSLERTVVVLVEPTCGTIIVPNVFTPNGDNKNDVLEITVGQVTGYSIVIYDRWGKEMYKSTDPVKSWDGTTEKGSAAVDGVYSYIIQSNCNGKTYKYQGFVQLIR